MPIHSPGPRLFDSVPFKHLGGKGKHGRKSVMASLNLTALVDMMTMLVVFLLMTFSATGEILMVQKGLTLPDAAQKQELKRAPIVCITADAITFNGEAMADPRTLAADTSMEWKIVELYERLKIEKQALELSSANDDAKNLLRGKLILQADKQVDAKVLNRVMKTCYAAEYPDIMFAVNQRARKQ